MISQFLIGATNSNCGKTTVAIGLMRAMCRRGMKVQPFKCGPDYIDTQFHHIAAGRNSINLDTFLASTEFVKRTFARHSANADAVIAEGVMGLFDGYAGLLGSSAQIAELLNIPVILVINARSMAYSAAPLIYGFKNFSHGVNIKGVIFNMVGSQRHMKMLKAACTDAGVECFGGLPRIADLEVPSRHLGLTLSGHEAIDQFAERAADIVEAGVDIERMIEVCKGEIQVTDGEVFSAKTGRKPLSMAIARDEAFSFIYPDNIDALLHHPEYKVDIKYFFPIADSTAPQADIIYLPGGYPELYAEQLSANEEMKRSISSFAASGGKILAECGGMIYLSQHIDGYPMCGVFPFACTMANAKLTLGYRHVHMGSHILSGHEFHYSRIASGKQLPSIARITNAIGEDVSTGMFRQNNVIAGYTHLYWPEIDIFKLWEH